MSQQTAVIDTGLLCWTEQLFHKQGAECHTYVEEIKLMRADRADQKISPQISDKGAPHQKAQKGAVGASLLVHLLDYFHNPKCSLENEEDTVVYNR